MNKQELITRIKCLDEPYLKEEFILDLIEQLDEPQKVKIPKFVAECIEYAQASDWDLEDVFQSIANELDTSEISVWFYSKSENMDTLASAWLYGYEIEKEKRYLVKMKGLRECFSYLNYDSIDAEWYFADAENGPAVGTHCTRKELESAGFGWVFYCPGVEIEEVEE